jgi:hypothetical protein
VCLACGPASAHHIRGIPHYSYSENYPDAPKVEHTRIVEDVTLTMTYYEIPGTQSVDLSLYVKNNRSGKIFDGTVTYAVYGEDEDPLKAHSVKALKNNNNLYKAVWVYEDNGLYYIRVVFKCDGQPVDTTFKMQIGATEVDYWFLGLIGGGVLALIIAVAAIKKAQTRGDKPEGDTEQ